LFVIALAGAIVIVLALCGWIVLRHRIAPRGSSDRVSSGPASTTPAPTEETPGAASPPTPSTDLARLQRASALISERLWRLAFGAEPAQDVTAEHARVRDAVQALLLAPQLDEKYFPRRPSLMPQLLRAMKDPTVGAGALAAIIVQDPVLTGDTLRLANASYYRTASKPIETIQRAVVICGTDGLQSLVATALMHPVFRATEGNFPRFTALLWERTARASRAAELHAANARREDRFEAQLLTLLNALGPLVVYRATLDIYARESTLSPSPELCVALIGMLGQKMSQRIARQWQSSDRLIAALDPAIDDGQHATDQALLQALYGGELLGTLSLLVTENALSAEEATQLALDAGLPEALVASIGKRLLAGS
jgi:HD-like signal output (HDOD) protein